MVDTCAVAGAAKSIAYALITEAEYLYGVEDRVGALQSDLECMQEFLKIVDANPSLLKQDGQLRILTHKMRELAFHAEDVVDTYVVDVGSEVYMKNFFLKLLCLASHCYPVHMLRKEIEAIQQEVDEAKKRCQDYRKMMMPNTFQQLGTNIGSSASRPTAENYLHLDDEFVVGIEDDVTRIVKRLTDPDDDFMVLGIVGTGGAGKTTLASKIYRHDKVQSSFSHRAFVSVSQQWSRFDLLHRISKEVMGHSKISSSETELVRELHDFMKDKKCLVVLDDIWKKEAWDDIYPIFPRTKGFRSILTTRIEEVPLYADKKCALHEPQKLTDDQMWTLFSKGAVEGRHGIESNAEFERLGKLMLQKCKGLPLAVVTLAGILRTKQYLYEWERINVACTNNILQEKGGSTYGIVEEMLELSYLELPPHLKPLFLYLAIIPEDKEFSAVELIQLWIAEGFVTDDKQMRCETLEDEAMWFLGELAQRFIFQVTKRDDQNQIEYLRLHDLMREFCMKKASECQFLENVTSKCSSKSRRISIFSREYYLEEDHYIRTVIYNYYLPDYFPDGYIQNLESVHKLFKLLRVLSLTCQNEHLPKEIGNMIHLTYLSLVDTAIRELPASIRNLRNLIYFECRSCFGEVVVPNDLVGNMKNLRLLVLSRLKKDCSSQCNSRLGLRSEQHKKLHTFNCGAGRWMTKDLPKMDFSSMRDLRFRSINEIEEMEAVHGCLSFFKGSLQTFECCFKNDSCKFDVEKLRDFQSLWRLGLSGRLLVNDSSLQFPPNLVTLILSGSGIREGVDLMGVLEQLPKLKNVQIVNNAYLGTQLSCAGTTFLQLREFMLWGLDHLEEWRVEGRAMDRLNKLHICDCPKLKRLPERIRSITTLNSWTLSTCLKNFAGGWAIEEMEKKSQHLVLDSENILTSFNTFPLSTSLIQNWILGDRMSLIQMTFCLLLVNACLNFAASPIPLSLLFCHFK